MKKTHILATLLALLTLAGCEKVDDGVDGMVEIFAESMSGGKVLLNGANSTWVTGDQIRLNGTTATVTRRDDRAYISSDGLADVNRAVYPASLVGSSLTSNNVSIDFPRYYHYRTGDGGQQILDLPMAAYSTGDNPLQFKHLTGALYITITNTASVPLTLQSVTVTSSNYQLSGTRNIDISTMSIEGSVYNSVDDKSVSLVFDENLTLSAGSNVRVMVPVLPVGSNQNFTIKVRSVGEDIANTYLYSRDQPNNGVDHSLQRNQLGYVPVSITAEESSSPLDQVNGAYVVRTPLEFCLMAQGITNSSIADTATIEIMEDINMSGYTVSPIIKASFDGTIHGNNKTISNLTIGCVSCGSGLYTCALFGYVGTPTIRNLNLDGITLDYRSVGRGSLYVGGLIGTQTSEDGTTIIENCGIHISSVIAGSPSGAVFFGGIMADASKNVAISNCNVSFTGLPSALTGSTVNFGGFIGSSGATKEASITSSICVGSSVTIDPTTGARVGGMIGNKASGNFTARSCEIWGNVNVTDGDYNYYGTMIGRYAPGVIDVVDTADNTLNFVICDNGDTVSLSPYSKNPYTR